MKKLICAVMALALCLAGCGAASESPELLEPVNVSSDMAQVKTGNVFNGAVYEGNIIPDVETLSFTVSGKIGEVLVWSGQEVKKGEPILRLDTDSLEKQKESLEERLEYAETMDGFETREAEITKQMLINQQGSYSAAYRLYANQQDSAAQDRAAEIADLKKQLKEINKNLTEESVITSPFDGIVAAVGVRVGDYVKAEQEVAAVADKNRFFLQTDYIGEFSVNTAAKVYAVIDGQRYDVSYVPIDILEYNAKTLAEETLYTNFTVKGGKSDMIGKYALLYLITSEKEQVLNIPVNALLRDADGYYVYTDENGKKVRRGVEVGMRSPVSAEIRSGLEEGEWVYVVG